MINQKPFCLWFTGLPCSGKSTISNIVKTNLLKYGKFVYLFDGDVVRNTINSDLGFSYVDRKENIRRIAHIVNMFMNMNIICLVAMITPLKEHREMVADIIKVNLIDVYVKCSLDICKSRDVKGYYKKADQNLITNYTGISSNYEEPLNSKLILDGSGDIMNCYGKIEEYLIRERFI